MEWDVLLGDSLLLELVEEVHFVWVGRRLGGDGSGGGDLVVVLEFEAGGLGDDCLED
jgi:hypothetical protein